MKYRLVLIGLVAACAPLIPEPPRGAPAEAQVVAAAATVAAAQSTRDESTFDGWRAGFLDRHGGAHRDVFARELAGLEPDPRVVRFDRAQPEFSRPAGAYIQNAVSAQRNAQGRQRLSIVPQSAESRHGVPPEILVSIWALESAFGAVQGDFDVVRSLATLAHDGRRRDWAEGQLKEALTIIAEGRAPRARLQGSWAGAMGQTQFMPDNYRRLAVDGDGDGVVDIWNSSPDALMSAANLLGQAGWKRGQGWHREVTLPTGFNYELVEGERRPWAFWEQQGVRLRGAALSNAEAAEESAILLPQGAAGPAVLALPNHYVIRRYNNSTAYALAVGLTADGIAGRPGLIAAWPEEAPLSRDQRLGAQRALAAAGFYTGNIDGIVGSGTRAAFRQWQRANGVTPDGHLSAAMADRLIASMESGR